MYESLTNDDLNSLDGVAEDCKVQGVSPTLSFWDDVQRAVADILKLREALECGDGETVANKLRRLAHIINTGTNEHPVEWSRSLERIACGFDAALASNEDNA